MKSLQLRVTALCLLLLLFCAHQVHAQMNQGNLELGKKLSKAISLNQVHTYYLTLEKGQFALINLEQRGLDMKVVTFDPAGNQLDEFDSVNGNNGPELVMLDGIEKGKYRIEAHPLAENKKVTQGVYEMELLNINHSGRDQLNAIMDFTNNGNGLPGFAVGVMNKDGLLYEQAYGFANIEKKIPYTTSTIHNVGSTTKTLIGLSIMKLVAEGKLTLDTKINEILPFEVVNPYYPEIPITVQHLANHTSTIRETSDYERSYVLTEKSNLDKKVYHKSDYEDFKIYAKNRKMPMAQFLENIVSKEGDWYRKKNFLKEKPGVKYHYSNAAATLAAHVVEILSGETFDVFTKKHILDPFGMQSAGLQFAQVDMNQHAMLYGFNKNPLPKYTLITYPDGGMIASIKDLNTYLMGLIKGYNGENKFLNKTGFQEMMRDHQTEAEEMKYGVFWEIRKNGMMGHNGGDPGIISMMYFNPETNRGVTFMSNIIPALPGPGVAFRNVWKAINRYAKHLE